MHNESIESSPTSNLSRPRTRFLHFRATTKDQSQSMRKGLSFSRPTIENITEANLILNADLEDRITDKEVENERRSKVIPTHGFISAELLSQQQNPRDDVECEFRNTELIEFCNIAEKSVTSPFKPHHNLENLHPVVDKIIEDFCSSPSYCEEEAIDDTLHYSPYFRFRGKCLRNYGKIRSKRTILPLTFDDASTSSSCGLSIQEACISQPLSNDATGSTNINIDFNNSQLLCENLLNLSAYYTQNNQDDFNASCDDDFHGFDNTSNKIDLPFTECRDTRDLEELRTSFDYKFSKDNLLSFTDIFNEQSQLESEQSNSSSPNSGNLEGELFEEFDEDCEFFANIKTQDILKNTKESNDHTLTNVHTQSTEEASDGEINSARKKGSETPDSWNDEVDIFSNFQTQNYLNVKSEELNDKQSVEGTKAFESHFFTASQRRISVTDNAKQQALRIFQVLPELKESEEIMLKSNKESQLENDKQVRKKLHSTELFTASQKVIYESKSAQMNSNELFQKPPNPISCKEDTLKPEEYLFRDDLEDYDLISETTKSAVKKTALRSITASQEPIETPASACSLAERPLQSSPKLKGVIENERTLIQENGEKLNYLKPENLGKSPKVPAVGIITAPQKPIQISALAQKHAMEIFQNLPEMKCFDEQSLEFKENLLINGINDCRLSPAKCEFSSVNFNSNDLNINSGNRGQPKKMENIPRSQRQPKRKLEIDFPQSPPIGGKRQCDSLTCMTSESPPSVGSKMNLSLMQYAVKSPLDAEIASTIKERRNRLSVGKRNRTAKKLDLKNSETTGPLTSAKIDIQDERSTSDRLICLRDNSNLDTPIKLQSSETVYPTTSTPQAPKSFETSADKDFPTLCCNAIQLPANSLSNEALQKLGEPAEISPIVPSRQAPCRSLGLSRNRSSIKKKLK